MAHARSVYHKLAQTPPGGEIPNGASRSVRKARDTLITLRDTLSIEEDLSATFKKIEHAVQQAGGLLTREVEETYFSEIREIFEQEGLPPWEPLAQSTKRERVRLGFPPEHPILQRTGSLFRSLTGADSLLVYEDRGDADLEAIWGTTDPRFPVLQWGSEDFTVPPRPMLPPEFSLNPKVAKACSDVMARLLPC